MTLFFYYKLLDFLFVLLYTHAIFMKEEYKMSVINVMNEQKNSNILFYVKSIALCLLTLAINAGFAAVVYKFNNFFLLEDKIVNIVSFIMVISFFLFTISYTKKLLNKLDNL